MKITAATLRSQPFFGGMSERQLELLAEESMLAEFKAGEKIINEGTSANRFYVILAGRVELESPMMDGRSISLQTLGKGDVLGWSWLYPPYIWHFDARAVAPTKALFFHGTRLREMCEENHDFGFELMKRVSEIVIRRLQAARRELVASRNNLLLPV